MYRLKVEYKEYDTIKIVHSLWYTSIEEAVNKGKKNLSGLYAQKCVDDGKSNIIIEIKGHKSVPEHLKSFYSIEYV
jgi:hypothetical protein